MKRPNRSSSGEQRLGRIAKITQLVTALLQKTNLRELRLNGWSIGDAGAAIFAENIRHFPQLQKLYLHDADIGEEGKKALIEANQARTNPLSIIF